MKNNTKTDLFIQKILVFAIIIVINLLSVYLFVRIDLTKGKAYSISKATKETLKSLKDEVDIKLFFSKNLPAQLNGTKTYVKDILSEYQTYSGGKLRFEFQNPNDTEKFASEAKSNKIPSLPIQVLEKDKMELRDVYMGMLLSYKENLLNIPAIQSTEGLEYRITTTIQKLINPERKKVAFFTPITMEESKALEELPVPDQLQSFYKILSSNYITDRTDLFYPLPIETDLLIVSSVSDSLHPVQLYNLDQYLMRGKPVIFLQNRYKADINEQEAVLIKSNIIDFLFYNSMIIKPNLVMDAFCYQISTYKQQGESVVPMAFDYPFFPMLHSFNKQHVISKRLDIVQMLFPSEIIPKVPANIKFTPLMMSSDNSYEVMGKSVNTYYNQFLNKDFSSQFNLPAKIIAALYEGSFTSYFKDKPIRSERYLENTDHAQVVVVACDKITDNELIKNIRGNAEFMLNTVDFLTGQSNMIEMRSRNIQYSGFKKTNPSMRQSIKILNFVLPPFFILISALIIWLRNREKQRLIKKKYGQLNEKESNTNE